VATRSREEHGWPSSRHAGRSTGGSRRVELARVAGLSLW
jgi:hypothetical protein